MTWFVLAIAAYAVMAFSQVLDKVFLDRFFRDSRAYAAFVGLAGGVVLFALPLTKSLTSLALWGTCLLAGSLFIAALFPFLSALQEDEATRIIPLTGAAVPLSALLMERLFLGFTLSPFSYAGVAFLIIGSVVLTASRHQGPRRSRLAAGKALLAGILFAASFVLSKYVYLQTDFWTGFVWMRAGGVIAGLAMILATSSVRQEIAHLFARTEAKVFGLYAANQALAAVGFGLQNAAIFMASASVVTAMQGVQYVFIIVFVLLFSRFQPRLLSERVTRAVLLEKLTATACLITGLALLAV